MPRLEVRVLREDYERLDPDLRRNITGALNGVVALRLEADNSHISVEWLCIEEGVNMATLTVDINYTTGEWEMPFIQSHMRKVLKGVRVTLQDFAPLFPKGMSRKTAAWQNPRPGARYEEDPS